MAGNVRAGTTGNAGRPAAVGNPAASWQSLVTVGDAAVRFFFARRVWVRAGLVALVVVSLAAATVAIRLVQGLVAGGPELAWRNPGGQGFTPTWPTLRGLVPPTLRVGTAVDEMMLNSDVGYRNVLASDFSAVTAENAMKWVNLEPQEGVYDWTASDRIVAFAQAHGQSVYGHALLWHSSIPSWISESISPERLRTLLRQHITTVVSRYRGKVWAWDVVNEVLAENGSLRDTLFLRKLGPGYIADAFRWAHEADPDARLFVNDYGVEGRTKKSDALFRLVRDLRAAGVPVLGVGFQSHLQWNVVPKDITGNLRRFATLGVSVAITELDVRIGLPVTEQKLQRQAALYRTMLNSCLDVSTCESFTVWGFTDAHSWIPGHYRGYGSACLFDSRFGPKPAHAALVAVLRQRGRSSPN